LGHFVRVCELVGGVLERPYHIGNGQSCGRWSVQTLGACTKPSQHSRFISPDNTHTGTDTERVFPHISLRNKHLQRTELIFAVHHHQLVSVTFVGLLRDFDSAA
jgi:hypothetical protein